jgi:hypothetical protein|tara:strand:+ start:882 stop:1094 length:213 start_codon:yes stop_codon:yes gene_type:complete
MRQPNEEETHTYRVYGVEESEPFEIEGQRCVINEYGDATFVEVFNDGVPVFTIQANLVKYIRRADASPTE